MPRSINFSGLQGEFINFELQQLDIVKNLLKRERLSWKRIVFDRAKDCKFEIHYSECYFWCSTMARLHGPQRTAQSSMAGKRLDSIRNDREENADSIPISSTTCTEVCRDDFSGRSFLNETEYDQSNKSLARLVLFNSFDVPNNTSLYTPKSKDITQTLGWRSTGFVVESIDKTSKLALPKIFDCNEISDNKRNSNARHSKASSPSKVSGHQDTTISFRSPHTHSPGKAHKVLEQCHSPAHALFAQHYLWLGDN